MICGPPRRSLPSTSVRPWMPSTTWPAATPSYPRWRASTPGSTAPCPRRRGDSRSLAALAERGIRRYGFHGLSYEYIVATLGEQRLSRAVLAHLGGGASLVAVVDGRSVDTTMGLTPSGGIVMSHRSGDLDPGVLVYLARELGYTPERLERLVDGEAGLLGLCGTADMRTVLTRRHSGDEQAALALEIYSTRLRMQIGAYTALLGGLDSLVFTGGIGAHAPAVRDEACRGLGHLGIEIDPERNRAGEPVISPDAAAVRVHAIETDESWVVARHTHALLTV